MDLWKLLFKCLSFCDSFHHSWHLFPFYWFYLMLSARFVFFIIFIYFGCWYYWAWIMRSTVEWFRGCYFIHSIWSTDKTIRMESSESLVMISRRCLYFLFNLNTLTKEIRTYQLTYTWKRSPLLLFFIFSSWFWWINNNNNNILRSGFSYGKCEYNQVDDDKIGNIPLKKDTIDSHSRYSTKLSGIFFNREIA